MHTVEINRPTSCHPPTTHQAGLQAWSKDCQPELYNNIYDLTFAFDGENVDSDYKYEPPSILAVDRTTRARLAPAYYRETLFFFRHRCWLPRARRTYLRQIKLRLPRDNPAVALEAMLIVDYFWDFNMRLDIAPVLEVNYWCGFHGAREWTAIIRHGNFLQWMRGGKS